VSLSFLPHAAPDPGYPAGRQLKGVGPAPGKAPDASPSDTDASSPRRLHCARCGRAITADAHRIEVAGRHAHVRENPAGFVFLFGCFARADGCAILGEPTAENSWFTGFTWQYASCGACHAHLGWFFVGEGTFFGLVLERLVEAP
jgi:hypothetical protein